MAAGDAGLELEIIFDAQARDQVELLEHQAQPVAPQLRPRGVAEVGQGLVGESDLAAVGAIQPRDQMQQRALAAAGFSRQRHALARRDFEVDAAQHHDVFAGGAIALGQVADAQHDFVAGCHAERA